MTRHSKVFVPVSVDEREPDKNGFHFCLCTLTPPVGDFVKAFPQVSHFKINDSEWSVRTKRTNITHWLEEKENVYVLTEEEFDFMQSYLSRLQAMLESGETYSFDNEYDFKDSIEIKDFFQSKTNPQTENK